MADFLLEVLEIDPCVDDGNSHFSAVEMLGPHLRDVEKTRDSSRISDGRGAAAS
jgi:hypothetical protein